MMLRLRLLCRAIRYKIGRLIEGQRERDKGEIVSEVHEPNGGEGDGEDVPRRL